MSVFKISPSDMLEAVTLNSINMLGNEKRVVNAFNLAVADIRKLIEEKHAIITSLVSFGKDSTVTLLIALEAYRQSIAEGKIEAERPFIVSTVNTRAEAIPMQFYVSYASKRLVSYAKNLGINIQFKLVQPSLNNEFFIRYVGGQKIPATPNRSGDCSVILKVDPNEQFVNSLVHRIKNTGEFGDYESSPIISCLGSRVSESTRRSKNMEAHNIKSKSADDLLRLMDTQSLKKSEIKMYAPISDWSTDDVFLLLSLAGSKPLQKSVFSVPGFLSDFGLLIEIYGNGTSETCQIVTGKSSGGSGCNGKARFGCSICTIVAQKDKTASSLSKLKRWQVLGVENTQRLRDWLYRVSSSMSERALHARAFDAVTYNRIALQPNILKPKHLDKIVRFASQLTQDSISHSDYFKTLVEQGRQDEHEGVACIKNDTSLPPKIKKAFLEMYQEALLDPKNLNYYFSEIHAILLSFRWSLDGIGAPFRPLAIWKQIERGEGWIPYPKLNSELLSVGEMEGYDSLSEAVMMPVLKVEDVQSHVHDPVSLLDLWVRPSDSADVFEEDMNCSITRSADESAKVEVSYELAMLETDQSNALYSFFCSDGTATISQPIINRVIFQGRVASSKTRKLLLDSGLIEEVNVYTVNKLDALQAGKMLSKQDLSRVLTGLKLVRSVPHLKSEPLFTGYNQNAIKALPKIDFSQRVSKVKKGKVVRGNSRMVFYPLRVDSRLHNAHQQARDVLTPDFRSHTQKILSMHDKAHQNENEVRENIFISEKAVNIWKESGGMDRALELHDTYYDGLIKRRHLRGTTKHHIRRFGGTQAVEMLLREGGVTIERKYWEQFKFLLKRTQVLDSLSMFDYQSIPIATVKGLPHAISMSQHRKDKVEILKVVRAYRNKQRQCVKEAIRLNSPGQFADVFAFLKNGVNMAISESINSHIPSLLKLSFDTHDVAVSQRSNVCLLWLAMQFDGVQNIDDLLVRVATAKTAASIKSSPKYYLAFVKELSLVLEDIKENINSALMQWAGTVEHLEKFNADSYSSKTEAKARFEGCVHGPHSAFFDSCLLQYWNPSLPVMLNQTKTMERKVRAILEEFKDVIRVIDSISKGGEKRVISKMSLADKLALLG